MSYRRRRKVLGPDSHYNLGVKAAVADGSDMLKSSTYLCNRDRQYLKKLHNAGTLDLYGIPVTTADKLLALGFIRQFVSFSKEDVAFVRKTFKEGEVDGKALYEIKNCIFKNLNEKSRFEITLEGQNALTVSIVANIKTL